MGSKILYYFPYFFLPLVLSLIFTPIVRFIALKKGIISYPRPDRWHKHPIALLGGISIYLASVTSAFLFGLINKSSLGLFIGATFLFVIGLADDKFHFTPYIKLFAQIIAGSIAVIFGIVLKLPFHVILAIPLTLLWIIAITNSFNLLDNIDGLATGIAAISFLILSFSSQLFFNNPLGTLSLVLFGACVGFLPYNFNPAKIFMGDSGSMFLGYSLAVISIAGTSKQVSNLFITMFIPVLILSVPIFDTIFVMIVRRLQGRSIFEGGKDHTSHHLVTLGLSPRKTVLLLYAISAAFGLVSILYSKVNIFVISIIAFLGIIILIVFGVFLFEAISSSKKYFPRVNKEERTIINSIFLFKRRIIEVLFDLIFVVVAYSCAYYLRFEGNLLATNLVLMEESLVWVILIKMAIFFIFGLYRGVWRYVGISDFITMFKVVTFGSIASILFLTFTFRFGDYSRAVLFIDWLLLLFLIVGSRFLFRIIGEFFSIIPKEGKRVLIFGAGDMGEMVAREIKRNKTLNYSAVGFIDDDPYKIGNKIHGIPVLGGRHKIKDLAQEQQIKELIIAIPSIDDIENLSEIISICKESGLLYRRIKGILDKEEIDEFK